MAGKEKKSKQEKKSLVIVESPSKAKTINKFLGRGFYVEASMGHVRDLPRSKLGVDLENNFEPHYVIPTKSKKTVTKLKKTAKKMGSIFLAPDPDREGEAISWHLAAIFQGNEHAIKRVVFNEITREAVRKAFEKPRDIDLNLVNAQQARRVMDRIVGYLLSPLLWEKVGSGLSAGRVQSVALRLIVEKENEIRAFTPEEYWTVGAVLSSRRESVCGSKFLAKLDKIRNEKVKISNAQEAQTLKGILEKETFRVTDVEEKERSRKPLAPFTTSKMQQEAYTKLGFTAAKTMQVAQKLYEGIDLGPEEGTVGLITYMRTDSVRVAEDAVEDVRGFVGNRYGEEYLPPSPNVFKSKKGAQDAHEAIRPTSAGRTPDTIQKYLSQDEWKLYRLIWCKFVSSQMNEAIDRMIGVSILAGTDYSFRATGMQNIFPGFTVVYNESLRDETVPGEEKKEPNGEEDAETFELPALLKSEELHLHEIQSDQHFTKPPARYNDASLVKTLEEKGIGRPSTYAPTIHTLLARHYVERKAGAFIPTEVGQIVTDLLLKHFQKIIDYDFTADMENELDKVEEGELEWAQAVKEFYEPFQQDLEEAKVKMQNMRKEPVATEYKCDVCGKVMMLRHGRFGKFLACSGFPECRYTRSVPTGFRCPNEGCQGEIVQRRSRNGRRFYGCSKYPECRYVASELPKPPEPQAMPGNTENPPGTVQEKDASQSS